METGKHSHPWLAFWCRNGDEAMLQSVGLLQTGLIAPLQHASNYTAYKNVCFLQLFQPYGIRTYFALVQS